MSGGSELRAHELVLRHVETHRDRVAIAHGDEALSYGALGYRVAAIAEGLRRRDVRPGDRVVVLIPMSIELYLVLLAVASLGAVVVFVEPASSLVEIARVVGIAKPRAFIGIPKAHALRLRYRAVARIPIAVAVTSRLAARALGAIALDDLELDGEGAALPRVAMKPTDPVLLTFSSGTTGAPKGAARTHEFLAAQHAAIGRMVRRRDDVAEVEMSAFAIVLLSTLCAGNTAVIPPLGRGVDDVDGAALVREIDARQVTILSGSPAFLAPIVDAAAGRHLFSVRRVVTGGAPVPVSLCEAADETLLPKGSLLVVYGSTEAEPIATIEAAEVRRDTAAATRAGRGLCVGRPDAAISLRLLTADHRGHRVVGPEGIDGLCVTEPGTVGEVAVAGAHVNETYYRDPDAVRATKVVDETGTVWHRTGDAGYLDDDGRLWIVGRVADTVFKGNDAFHPAAVEAAAQTIPGVERAALIDDGRGGTRLVVQSQRRVDARSVINQLAGAGVTVDSVRRARTLPVDPRHRAKLDYRAIREEYAR